MGEKGQAPSTSGAASNASPGAPAPGMGGHIPTKDEIDKLIAAGKANDLGPSGFADLAKKTAGDQGAADASQGGMADKIGAGITGAGASVGSAAGAVQGGGEKGQAGAGSSGNPADASAPGGLVGRI